MIDSGPAGEFNRREFMGISAAAIAGAAGVTVADAGVEEAQSIEPFSIKVPDSQLRDLRERLGRTRFPDQLDGQEWNYGTELSYLKELCAYWRSEFDWRTQERALNRFSHFRTEIDSMRVHFIHQRSKEPNALPLIVTHGWPSSVTEFTKIIGPLTDPTAHGGRAEDAFHVICPSIPGYGYSDAPKSPGVDCRRVADVLVKLMNRLGYLRYGAQGGDWGGVVSTWMAAVDKAHVVGLHLNTPLGTLPEGTSEDVEEGSSPEEVRDLEEIEKSQVTDNGYAAIQSTRPQTLGYALNDSPAGLAAWIVEKFRSWSDCDGTIENSFTKDELLTNITIYWLTQTITSSMRLYYEMREAGWKFLPETRIDVPTACALFPAETNLPRKWVEESYNVTRWTPMPSGGHFPALEKPELLVEDIRESFRGIR